MRDKWKLINKKTKECYSIASHQWFYAWNINWWRHRKEVIEEKKLLGVIWNGMQTVEIFVKMATVDCGCSEI